MRFRRGGLAVLLGLTLALSSVAVPAVAQSQQEAAAQVRFGKGRDLFMEKKYGDALVEFRSANELFASPNTRLYIARCEREVGHPGRAYVEFQRAASDAADRARSDPKYATTRDTARQEAQALEGKFGKLTVKAKDKDTQGVSITVAGVPFGAAALGVATPVDPGNVEVAATAKGKLPFKKTVAVKAGESAEVTIALEADPNATTDPTPDPNPNNNGNNNNNGTGPTISETSNPPPTTTEVERTGGGVRIAGLFVIGAGVAGFVGFGVFAAVAQSQFDQLKTLKTTCGQPGKTVCPTPESVKSKIGEGERNQTIANVGLGIGIGAFIIGGIMFAAGGPTTVTKTKTGRLVPILNGGPDGAFAGVEGAF